MPTDVIPRNRRLNEDHQILYKMLDELEGNRRMANQIAAKVFGPSGLNQASLPVGPQVIIDLNV